jgi:hypothetical protein
LREESLVPDFKQNWLKMGLLEDFATKYRDNRKVLLFIVYVALFLDNMLLTTVGEFEFWLN